MSNVYITDEDREQLGELISNGFTGGRLDCGNGKHITWDLKLDVWSDAEKEEEDE